MMICKIAILVAFGLASCSLADARRCTLDDSLRAQQCALQRGVMDNYINVTTLLQYCRSPERDSWWNCYERAHANCDIPQSPEQLILSSGRISWASKSLDYLCSQDSVVEANQGCLGTALEGIQHCVQSATDEYMQEVAEFRRHSRPSLEDTKRQIERLFRNYEECIYSLLRTDCNDGIANAYGNFFYGLGPYVFELSSQSQ